MKDNFSFFFFSVLLLLFFLFFGLMNATEPPQKRRKKNESNSSPSSSLFEIVETGEDRPFVARKLAHLLEKSGVDVDLIRTKPSPWVWIF